MNRESAPPPAVPAWLARLVYGGLLAVLAGAAALALGLARGWADPQRAGPLRWEYDFKSGAGGWHFAAPPGVSLAPRAGALVADFSSPAGEAWAVGLAPASDAPVGDFTLEVAGGAAGNGSAYGLVFGWQDDAHYSAMLINANGYAEAYRQAGGAREVWFEWQQWPHILVGPENNRLRVDVAGADITLRVNDEVVVRVAGSAHGQVGVAARAGSPGAQVVFSWVRLWAPAR